MAKTIINNSPVFPNTDLDFWLEQNKDLRGRGFKEGDVSRPGLLVLDLMKLFCDPASPAFLDHSPAILFPIFYLARKMIDLKRPVVFTRHVHNTSDFGGLIKRFFGRLQYRDDPLSQLISETAEFVPPAAVIDKQRHSALLEPSANQLFQRCNSLIIAGVQTHLCVLSTAIDCARCGLTPIVPIDATAARDGSMHLDSIRILGSGHAFIWTVEEIDARLQSERLAG